MDRGDGKDQQERKTDPSNRVSSAATPQSRQQVCTVYGLAESCTLRFQFWTFNFSETISRLVSNSPPSASPPLCPSPRVPGITGTYHHA